MDIDDNFNIDRVPISGKGDKISRIRDLAKGANSVFLAPDMDREGEAIAFHLVRKLAKKRNLPSCI